MKFHCETWEQKKARLGRWHRKFVWFPVRCPDIDRCVWLERVWRRMDRHSGYSHTFWEKEYRYSL